MTEPIIDKLNQLDDLSKLSDLDTNSDTSREWQDARVENVTNSLVTIPTEHAAIHRGYAYSAVAYTASLAFGGKIIYRFVTPITLYPHVKSWVVSTKGASLKASLIKNPTILTQGTPQDIICQLNHNSSTIAKSKIYTGATYSGGSICDFIIVHGNADPNGRNSTASSFSPTDYFEYVFVNGEQDYILEIENIDTDENTAYEIMARLFMYEEPNGIES